MSNTGDATGSHAKVALITGGGTGLGAAIALSLAADGYDCVVTGRRPDPLEELADTARDLAGSVIPFAADVATAEGRTRLLGGIAQHFERVDALVNNAGILNRPGMSGDSIS